MKILYFEFSIENISKMLLKLCQDLILQIAQNLNMRDILHLKITNRYFCKLISQDFLNNINIMFKLKYPKEGRWKWIYPMLRTLKNYVVAGGHALQVYHNEDWISSDFDIFFYNQTSEKFISQVFNLFKNLHLTKERKWSWNMRPGSRGTFKHLNTIKLEQELKCNDVYLIRLSGVTSIGKNSRITIDLVYTKYISTVDLLDDFDLPICGIGFVVDPYVEILNFVKSTTECYQSAKDRKCLIYDTGGIPWRYGLSNESNFKIDSSEVLSQRIKKYTDRGFKIETVRFHGNKGRSINEKYKSRQNNVMHYTC